MKKLILFLLLPLWAMAQTSTTKEQEFDYGIKNNSTQTITTPPYLTTTGMDGTQGKIPSALIEKTDNKQNSLAGDGTGTKYPTVDAVNTGLGLKQNTLTNPLTGVGSELAPNTYALQDGTILYHSAKWFIPTSTVSTNGTTVTSVGTQFTSAMVGAKLTINGEWRVITAYTNSTTVITQSGYSQNYSNVVAGNWGCYSMCSSITSTGQVYYYSYQGIVMFTYVPSDQYNVRFSGFSITGNEVAIQSGGASLRESAKIFWSNNATYYGTKDLGLRRNSAGVLEIYDGITATGLEANRRDLLARNLFGSKVLIGSIVDDNVNQGQYTGTVSSGTTALNNTPPIANNQLTRKDYVDTGLALKANLASPSLTGTPTAPTAPAGTNTTQIATTAFVQAVDANVVHKTGEETIGLGEKYFTDNVNFTDIAVSGQAVGMAAVFPNEFVIKSQLDLKAPLSGSENYIQNQNAAAQSANMWISGSIKAKNIQTLDDVGGFYTYGRYSSGQPYSLNILSDAAQGFKFTNSSAIPLLTIESSGAALFTSTVTASSFNGSATLTGTPTAPTATAGTNTTQIATTAFVQENKNKLQGYTVATLPAGTIGDMAYVTDASGFSYNTVVVGGGSGVTIVFFDGTNWRAH